MYVVRDIFEGFWRTAVIIISPYLILWIIRRMHHDRYDRLYFAYRMRTYCIVHLILSSFLLYLYIFFYRTSIAIYAALFFFTVFFVFYVHRVFAKNGPENETSGSQPILPMRPMDKQLSDYIALIEAGLVAQGESMICPYCRKYINGINSQYCIYCGSNIGQEQNNSRPVPLPAANVNKSDINSSDIRCPNVRNILGTTIDLHLIARMYPKNKSGANDLLRRLTLLHDWHSKYIIHNLYGYLGPQLNTITPDDSRNAKTLFFNMLAYNKYRYTVYQKISRSNRIAQLERDGVAYCPKCLSVHLMDNKKQAGIDKGVVGSAASEPTELTTINTGTKKTRINCMKCGHHWKV
jgi:hypothetical protein